MFQWEPVKS